MWHGQAVTFIQENNSLNDTPKLKLNVPEINLLTVNSSNYNLVRIYVLLSAYPNDKDF